MRIEIDPELASALDAIKREEPLIYGRGHVETVRFLANYYHRHMRIDDLLNQAEERFEAHLKMLDDTVEKAIENSVLRILRQVILNLFAAADEKGTVERSDIDQDSPRGGR